MRIGNRAWISGWTGLSVLLAFVASLVGPGQLERTSEPIEMVRIAPGPFTMGSEVDSDDERPAHTLELRAFEIDKLPVVNAQFAAFMNETGASHTAYGMLYSLNDPAAKILWVGGRYAVVQGFEQHPVVAETWQGARAFCAWRGARLPTEAEWERAARGPSGRSYPWGNEPPDASRARFAFRYLEISRVGSYPAGATRTASWTWPATPGSGPARCTARTRTAPKMAARIRTRPASGSRGAAARAPAPRCSARPTGTRR